MHRYPAVMIIVALLVLSLFCSFSPGQTMKYLKHLRQRIDKNVNTQRLIVGKFNRAYHQQCGALASVRSQPCRSEFRSASTSQANVALSPNIDNQSLHDIEVPRSSRAVDAILVSKLDETLHILENKIGGPNIWVKRLEGLRDDLYAERRGRISGERVHRVCR